MEDTGGKGLEIEKKEFEEVIKKFESKSTKSYNFLLKSGNQYKEVVISYAKR